MSIGKGAIQGDFGRAALLAISAPVLTHAHPHCHVLIKVSGADSVFRVQDRDCPLDDDSLVVVNAWQPHAYPHARSAPKSTILALYVEPAWLKAIDRSFAVSTDPAFFARPCFPVTPPVRKIAQDMAEAMSTGRESERGTADLLLALMIAVIESYSDWRALRGDKTAGHWTVPDFRVRRAIGFMRETIGHGFTADDVARAAGLSRAHLFERFKRNTGLTPNLYFNALRMEAAYEDLSIEATSMATISTNLGFSAQSHFSRFFRNNLGIAPRDYRHLVREAARHASARPDTSHTKAQ